jgi:hypothetical protein
MRLRFDACTEEEENMAKYFVLAVVIACVVVLVSVPMTAQKFQTSGVKAQAGAKDANVKNDNPVNSPDVKKAPPPKKGGPAAKGGMYCDGHVDNRTPYYVRYYMNGDLEAIIGPYGDYYPAYTHGTAVLYGKVVFDDGSVSTFGPREYVCTGNDFTWTLAP